MLKDLLKFLGCPKCGCGVELSNSYLKCRCCGRSFPIREGFPDFRVGECFKGVNTLQRILYNMYAPFYDVLESRLIKLYGVTEDSLREEVVSSMDIGGGDAVLEVSIGTCGNVPYFRRFTEGPIVGLDISEKMLSRCVENLGMWSVEDVYLVLGCGEYLPFKEGVFDRVLIGGAFTYFSDPRRALREAARVTRASGFVVVYDQVTFIDRATGRDKLPVRVKPEGLELLSYRYLFGKLFYVAKFLKH